jgi:hypothetical protein
MADDPKPADAAHAMQTVTRYPLHQKAARGRFGRDVPALAADDVPMSDARMTTMQSEQTRQGAQPMGYEIDPDAVAAAIVDRLMAGGTLRSRAEDD